MTNDFAEIRDAVARLCADFPGRYWRDKDRARAYPTEFVEALVGRGLSGRADSRAIRRVGAWARRRERRARGDPQERLQRRGVSRADVHDGHAAEARQRRAEARVPAADRGRHAAAAGVRRHGADERNGHHADSHHGRARRRRLPRQRPEGVHLADRALGPDAAARAHDGARAGRQDDRWHVGVHRRSARGGQARAHDQAARDDDESRDDGAVLRQPRSAGRQPRRRRGQGFRLHPRQHECRADLDRLGVHRRRALVRREGRGVREGAAGLRPADRREPGRTVPDRPRATCKPKRPR